MINKPKLNKYILQNDLEKTIEQIKHYEALLSQDDIRLTGAGIGSTFKIASENMKREQNLTDPEILTTLSQLDRLKKEIEDELKIWENIENSNN